MSLAPRNAAEYVPWAQSHADLFVTNATLLGVPAASASAYKTAADALSKTLSSQVDAADAARAATATLNDAVDANRRALADIIRLVRVKAAASADPQAIYTAAGIPAPASPSPVAPPGLPRDFTVTIISTGAPVLRWKCTNPVNGPGTVYKVERTIGVGNTRTFCGLAGGEKTFTDSTLPLGTDAVTYFVTGQRSGVIGPTGEVNVRFGTVGGNATATVVGANVKLAA